MIDPRAVEAIFRYHFNPWGASVDGTQLTPSYGWDVSDRLMDTFSLPREPLKLNFFSNHALNYLSMHIDKSERVYVALSGGVDSTFLAILAQHITPRVIGVNLTLEGGYDEYTDAKCVADALNMPLQHITASVDDVVAEMPKIVRTFGEPIDRGSLIAAYFLHRAIPSSEKIIIGQYADSVFAPMSFKPKLDIKDVKRLFARPYLDTINPYFPDDHIRNEYAMELMHAIPFDQEGLEHRKFARATVLMPWAQPEVLEAAALQCPHSPDKVYERMLAATWSRESFPLHLLAHPKRPFNFQPEHISAISKNYLHPDILDNLDVFNNGVDWDNESGWTQYLAALLCLWAESHEA